MMGSVGKRTAVEADALTDHAAATAEGVQIPALKKQKSKQEPKSDFEQALSLMHEEASERTVNYEETWPRSNKTLPDDNKDTLSMLSLYTSWNDENSRIFVQSFALA
jgi:hypothetical protein